MRNSHYYLILQDDIDNTLQENIIEEAVQEIKEEWKDRVKEYMGSKLSDLLK